MGKKYLGGIRQPEDMRNRSRVDDGDCWHWRGAMDKYGRAKVWFDEWRCTTTVAPLMGFFRTGERPSKKVRWLPMCSSDDCVNHNHWKRSTHSAAVKAKPRKNPALHALKVAAARRASSKLSEEDVVAIRAKDESIRACAQRFNVSIATVHRIRRGEQRRPLVMPGTSIFNLGG